MDIEATLPAAQIIAFSADGDKLILADMDATVHVIKIADFGSVATFDEHQKSDSMTEVLSKRYLC